VAKNLLADKKSKCLNVLTSAVMWTIWKTRNDLCFQDVQYEGVVPVLCKNVGTLEIYTKTRRSHKPGGTVSRAGKDRRKTTKVALESAWTRD
jgi:hypothetical protein